MKKINLSLLLIFFTGLIAYFPSLFYGFAQDDFIHLSASQASNFWQVLNFFSPTAHYPDIFFYRPLTTQFWFFINTHLFGLNPLPFHIEALVFQAINACLFYLVVKKLWKSDKIARLSGLFYALSAAHFLSLYYISAFQEVGRMFFVLMAILTFLKYLDYKKTIFYGYSILSFILALLSKETSLILPVLLVPVFLLYARHESIRGTLKELLRLLTGFAAMAGLFITIRIIGFQSIFGAGDYHLTSSVVEIFQNLKWYILWSFGLPEALSTYPSLKPDSLMAFSRDLPFGGIVLGFFGIFGVMLLVLIIREVRKPRIFNFQFSIFNSAIFLIALLPVLFLSGHRYPQYLDLAFLGVLPPLAWLLTKTRLIGYLAIITFVLLQLSSLELSRQSHWSTHRSMVADYYHQQLTQLVGQTGANLVIFTGSQSELQQVSYALAKDYATRVWFNCQVGKVLYLTPEQAIDFGSNTVILPITKY